MTDPQASGEWRSSDKAFLCLTLIEAGVNQSRADAVTDALIAAGLVVMRDYYVPTSDELFSQYSTLGAAYLEGRIRVRWVMCAETSDALYARYSNRRYVAQPVMPFSYAEVEPSTEVLRHAVRTVMEGNRRWSDKSTLFGIPIRIDPVARRPVFEIETP